MHNVHGFAVRMLYIHYVSKHNAYNNNNSNSYTVVIPTIAIIIIITITVFW